jgi:predicted dithiol-disulfide oxidoreductase (DUF899 family)
MSILTVDSVDQQISELQQEIASLSQRYRELIEQRPDEPVENHVFQTPDGEVTLLDLFGDRDDLIVVHNMGQGCSYCTMWADAYNGSLHNILDRTAFVVVSDDAPDVQSEVARIRGWKFRMASDPQRTFSAAMNFERDGMVYPGYSAFHRDGDSIVRTGWDVFGPGDRYCAVWPMFDALKDGANDWDPKPASVAPSV